MKVPVRCPELGDFEETITVSCWLAEKDEPVEQGERIVELLISGITFDVESPSSGRLTEIETEMDNAVRPGNILGWIEQQPESTAIENE